MTGCISSGKYREFFNSETMNLLSALQKTLTEKKSAIVFVSSATGEREVLTYSELYEVALRVLGALQARGLKAGDELVIQTENNRDFVCLFWGCLFGGIIPVPLSGGVQAEQKLKFFQVWKYLSNPYLACDAGQVERLKSITGDEESLMACFNEMEARYFDIAALFLHTVHGTAVPVQDGDIAYIQFSSGSTGMPKGVCLTHENLVANVQDISDSLHISDSDTLFNWMPLTHDMGIIGFHLLGVWRGLDAVSMSTGLLIRRPLSWMDLVSEFRATVLYSPNFGLQYFLNSFQVDRVYDWDLSCIRIIVNGAEPISAKLCEVFTSTLAGFGLRPNSIVAAYGLAESSVEVSTSIPGSAIRSYYLNRQRLGIGEEVEIFDEELKDTVSFVEVGKVAGSCSLRICNERNEVLPERVIGHIQIKGKNVTGGYYNNEEATKEIFTADGWLKTGDLGFLINDMLVVTGRLKNIIIVNGQNYYPQDIERVVIDWCGLEAGKVVACGTGKDRGLKEQLIVFILHKGTAAAFASVVAAVREAVFTHIGIQVDAVVAVTRIPKTTSGKIRHFKLVEDYLAGEYDMAEAAAVADSNTAVLTRLDAPAVEQLLVREASGLLGNARVDRSTDFFDLGMNSLVAMQLAERLSRLTGRHISVNAVFGNPDIVSLGNHILSAAPVRQVPVLRFSEPVPHFGLSLAQQRLYGEYLLNKDSAAYNIPVVYAIEGDFKTSVFELALAGVIERYEILRTSFRVVDDGTIQEVHAPGDVRCSVQRMDVRDGENSAVEVERIISAEVNSPFLLERPGQYRITEVVTGADTRILVFVIHHILVDGWSLELIFNELFTVYNSLIRGVVPDRRDQPYQYRDYVAWQRELLFPEAIERDRDYWRGELKGLPDPVDMSAVADPSFFTGHPKVGHLSARFSVSATERLEGLAKKYNVSAFSLLLSFLNVIIYRYTNRKDIVVGYDSAMRISPELEGLVGYTLNTLCLRTAIDGTQRFPEFAAAVHQKVMDGLDHQLYFFEQMLEDAYTERNGLGNPLFSILVLFQNFYHGGMGLTIEGCTAKKQLVPVRDGFTDLVLEFGRDEAGLLLDVYYNEGKYTGPEILRFTQHFHNLVQGVYGDDTLRVSKYDFLTAWEKGLLFGPAEDDLNRAEAVPVHIQFEQRVLISPDVIAVRAGDCALTYKELNRRANAVAGYLINSGSFNHGDRVGFFVGRNEKMIIAMLGVLKAGGAYVALDPEYPVGRCRQIAADSEMKHLLTDGETTGRMKGFFGEGFLVDMDGDHFLSADLPDAGCKVCAGDLAYIIYTSGSTGQPKGVMIEHGSLSGYVQAFSGYFAITAADVVLQQASVAFDTIVEEVFPALCSSASVVIAPHGGRDTGDMLSLIASYGVTILSTTPLVLNEINGQADDRTGSLRLVISGGDVLHSSHIDRLFERMPVYNTYGPSEATVCATYHAIGSLADAGRIGRALYNRHIYITDENNEVLPWGRAGEICIAGGLARGYLNLPQLTAEKFISLPFDDTVRVYRTGDRGRFLENGELVFLGRLDEQLKLSGHRIEPGEIEKVIGSYGGVELAVVVPDGRGEQLVACITVNETYAEDELRVFLSGQLPYYMLPQRFCIFDRMPETITGKVNRKLVAELALGDMAGSAGFRGPEGFLQKKLVGILQDILQVDGIGVDDNFFEHGCNSIKASRLRGYIGKALGYDVSIRDIFLFPTVALLAGKMEQGGVLPSGEIVPAAHASSYALSPSQKRLWLLFAMNKNSFAYNEGELIFIEGDFDPEKARLAFEAMVDRHEILRTTFEQKEAEPCQIVHDAAACLPVFVFEDFSGGESAFERGCAFAEQQIQKPFDLTRGPLCRIVVIRTAPEAYIFTMAIHHIITDDWSAGILMQEFQRHYQRLQKGDLITLPVPVLQYKDYANWIYSRADEGQLLQGRAYWLNQYRGEVPVLDIFPDFPRPAVKGYEGGMYCVDIGPELVQQITALCKAERISLFMFLLSGLYVLLYRYSGQSNLVVGTPVADREHPDLKNMPGFFINTLPLGIELCAEDTMEDTWRKVKSVCLDGFAHQSYPLELLVEELHVQRDLSRSPLFDVLINLSSGNGVFAEMEGMVCRRLKKSVTGSKYDLEFYFEEQGERLTLSLVYDKHLFAESRVARMAEHLQSIFQLAVTVRTCPAGSLPYFAGQELEKILIDFQGPVIVHLQDLVPELFLQQVERNGDSTAVYCRGCSYSYREINGRANFLAERLIKDYAVHAGDRVVLLLERDEHVIVAILAVWKAGAAYVPVDVSFPEERVARIINISGASLVVTDAARLAVCDAAAVQNNFKTLCVNDTDGRLDGMESKVRGLTDSSVAYILFTSGSTGEPKGVEVPHSALSNLLQSLKRRVGMEAGASLLSVSSYTFDISLSEFFLPLISGSILLLATTEEVLNVRKLHRLLLEKKPVLMQATPGLWNALVDSGWEGSGQLTAITCGEPLSDSLRNKLLDRTGRLWNLYGPTETTIFSVGTEIVNKEDAITIGRPMDNTSLFILDERLQPVPVGVQGQLYIGGKGLACGYRNQPELTQQKFPEGLPFYPGRVYATGDLARWLPDGTVDYMGRVDSQVKIRGFRIELEEIENVLLQCGWVRSVTVLITGDSSGDKMIVAFVVADAAEGEAPDMDKLQTFLRLHLPLYMIPAHYVPVTHIPLTVNGKVDRRRLLSWMDEQMPAYSNDYTAPGTRIEKMLAEIWGEILGRELVGITDDFFNIGGNSLKANQLVNQIYNRLSLEIMLADIFKHTTIQRLGALIESLEKEQYDFLELA